MYQICTILYHIAASTVRGGARYHIAASTVRGGARYHIAASTLRGGLGTICVLQEILFPVNMHRRGSKCKGLFTIEAGLSATQTVVYYKCYITNS